jgi:hypothetical protein
MRGWPLDTKVKPVAIGTCYHTVEVGSKGFNNLRLVVPPLTIVDTNAKVPCCRGGKISNEKKAVELETMTNLQVDMVKI